MENALSKAVTSFPSKSIVPAVGFSERRMSLFTVVFPLPDSPAIPKQVPWRTEKVTPSTAFSIVYRLRRRPPVAMGKYFFNPSI